jgi:hypothetical protein
MLNFDYINLGFSGNAMGEDEIANYIASLDMSVFVCDYDYNAPTAEHLAATHDKLYRKVRAAHPSLPIIFLTRPRPHYRDIDLRSFEVVKKTYEQAVTDGDKNVSFIDGRSLFAIAGTDGTVDATHPNDLGFLSMASRIAEVLGPILETIASN